MNKLIKYTFLFLFIPIGHISAQTEWAPVGAKWYYSTPYLIPPYDNNDCTLFESIGDTIISGKNCRIIEVKNCRGQQIISREFFYQKNDSLYYFNNNDFFLLYDFSAAIGDTVVVHDEKFFPTLGYLFNDSIESFKYKILNTDTINIGGTWSRRQQINQLQSGDWMLGIGQEEESWIIEKLGSYFYFFGRFGYFTFEESFGLLRCYSDSLLEYQNPEWNEVCDYISNAPDINVGKLIRFYPNPANDKVFIELMERKGVLTIYNLNGQLVYSKNLDLGINAISIGFIWPGIYFLNVLTDKRVIVFKLIKN